MTLTLPVSELIAGTPLYAVELKPLIETHDERGSFTELFAD